VTPSTPGIRAAPTLVPGPVSAAGPTPVAALVGDPPEFSKIVVVGIEGHRLCPFSVGRPLPGTIPVIRPPS